MVVLLLICLRSIFYFLRNVWLYTLPIFLLFYLSFPFWKEGCGPLSTAWIANIPLPLSFLFFDFLVIFFFLSRNTNWWLFSFIASSIWIIPRSAILTFESMYLGFYFFTLKSFFQREFILVKKSVMNLNPFPPAPQLPTQLLSTVHWLMDLSFTDLK